MQAKIEQRAPELERGTEKREAPKVVNIMEVLKKSMQARGQTKVRGGSQESREGSATETSSRCCNTKVTPHYANCPLAVAFTNKPPTHFAAQIESLVN